MMKSKQPGNDKNMEVTWICDLGVFLQPLKLVELFLLHFYFKSIHTTQRGMSGGGFTGGLADHFCSTSPQRVNPATSGRVEKDLPLLKLWNSVTVH